MSKYKWALIFNKISNAENKARDQRQRRSIASNFWKPKYNEYLQSPEWRAKREECLHIHGDSCVRCGDVYAHIHHISYKRLGNECPEHDLVPLCAPCHEWVHSAALRDLDDSTRKSSSVDLSALTGKQDDRNQDLRIEHGRKQIENLREMFKGKK